MKNNQSTDLTGLQAGYITVLSYSHTEMYAGSNTTFWYCLCELCGNKEVYPRVRLTNKRKKIDRCDTCKRGPCAVCGKKITTGKTMAFICSSSKCKLKWKTFKNGLAIKEKVKENPDFWKDAYQKEMQKRAEDPEYNQDFLSSARTRQAKSIKNESEEKRQVRLKKARERYHKKKAALKARIIAEQNTPR
ncbi:hypothetical protein CJF42_25025, partial [Pseudoalteromonas sp. NBT06-2]|uniref:hypothetical protein n=1 Tax=Pseudoalteromonas sp. NBT06-2 TaxID=2025950 RepID=UPI000BCDB079